MKRASFWIFASLGSISLLYYVFCGCLYSFTLSGLWIWAGFALIMCFLCLWQTVAEPRIMTKYRTLYKYVSRIFIGMLSLFMGLFVVFEILLIGQWHQGIENEDKKCDTVLVLGATVEYDRPGDALQKRIETAFEVIRNNPDAVVIACGGLGEGDVITEAACIKECLVEMGIDSTRIITEEKSTSTAENFRFAKELIPESTETVAVVTGGFHQFRAMTIGRSEMDMSELYPVSAPCGSFKLPRDMVREFAAFVKGLISSNI